MIEQALFTHVTSDIMITALIYTNSPYPHHRFFPNKIPQGELLPAATYQQNKGDRVHHMEGPAGMVDSEYTIICYGTTYPAAKELAEAVRKRLDGYRGIVAGVTIDVILLIDELDVPEFKPGTDILSRYGKQLTFTVWFKESVT
jgi:hypothetical protein